MRRHLQTLGSFLLQWHVLWLIVAGIFGTSMVFILPPLQVMDEPLHFSRSVALSQGNFFCFRNVENIPGMMVPPEVRDAAELFDVVNVPYRPNIAVSQSAVTQQMQTKPGDPTAFVQHPFCETPFWSSIPQAIGIDVAKIFGGSLLDWLYAGRIANLIASLILIGLAIRLTPVGKPFFAVTASLPMFLQQISSLSLDGMHYSLLFLFTALTLRLAYSDKKLTTRLLVGFVLLSIAAIHAKTGFVFFALLIFLLQPKHFKNKKIYGLFTGVFVLLHFVLFAIIRVALSVSDLANKGAINREDQMAFVLSHPLDFVASMLRAIESNFDFYWKNMLGILGWIDTPLMHLHYLLLLGVLLVLVARRTEDHLKVQHRVVLLTTWVLVMVSIFAALYAISTPVGAPEVMLVQGKYFLPVLPLLLLAFHNVRLPKKWLMLAVMVVLLCSGALMLRTVNMRFNESMVVDAVPLKETATPVALTSKSLLQQHLITTAPNLRGMSIYVQRPSEPTESVYRLTLRDSKCSRILTQKQLPLTVAPDRGYLTVFFDPLDVPVGTDICWEIDPDQRSVVQPLSVFVGKELPKTATGTTLASTGRKIKGEVIFKALYKK